MYNYLSTQFTKDKLMVMKPNENVDEIIQLCTVGHSTTISDT